MRSTAGSANTGSRQPETFEALMDLFVNRLKENKEMETRLKQTRIEFNSMRIEADKLEELVNLLFTVTKQMYNHILFTKIKNHTETSHNHPETKQTVRKTTRPTSS